MYKDDTSLNCTFGSIHLGAHVSSRGSECGCFCCGEDTSCPQLPGSTKHTCKFKQLKPESQVEKQMAGQVCSELGILTYFHAFSRQHNRRDWWQGYRLDTLRSLCECQAGAAPMGSIWRRTFPPNPPAAVYAAAIYSESLLHGCKLYEQGHNPYPKGGLHVSIESRAEFFRRTG